MARRRRGRRGKRTVLEPEGLEQGLELFRRLLEEDPVLREEYLLSAAQYFVAGQAPDPATPEGASAAHRHLEWFLFERVSDPVRELSAEQLLERWRQRAPEDVAGHQEAFLESYAGIFAVTDVDPGRGAWLQDLAGLGRYPVAEPEASRLLASGDLIVGRLYPVGEALYRISRGAGFFREPDLVRALEADMQRLREARSHAILRIAQRELEATFWGPRRPVAADDPVGEARRTLALAQVPAAEIEDILARLAAVPLDPRDPTPGIDDPLAEVLAQLAFHSDVDLGLARRQLLLAWRRLSQGEAAPPAGSEPGREAIDVRRAVDELDRRLRAGEDVGRSFDELEQALGLDRLGDEEPGTHTGSARAAAPGPEQPAEVGDTVPDFPGVVGAMVEEYLWEADFEGEPVPSEDAGTLRLFGRFEHSLGVFEELRVRDVLRFAAFWLPESGTLESAAGARTALEALGRFCHWAERVHALPNLAGVQERLGELELGLARVALANQSLEVAPSLEGLGAATSVQGPRQAGQLYEFLADLGQGRARVRDLGDAEHELWARPQTTRLLAQGDRVRASLEGGRLLIHCCYPAQIAQLAPGPGPT